MRAIIKLIATGAVIGVFALDGNFEPLAGYSLELAIGGAVLLAVVAILIARLDRPGAVEPRVTQRVTPIATVAARPMIRPADDDIEGRTVRAPMSSEAAHQMHQRYAPAFDQQLAINRHLDRYGDENYAPGHSMHGATFDQQTYEAAIENARQFDERQYTATNNEYARLFDEQLSQFRKTMAYEAPRPPTRTARGSGGPDYYRRSQSQSHASQSEPADVAETRGPRDTGVKRGNA